MEFGGPIPALQVGFGMLEVMYACFMPNNLFGEASTWEVCIIFGLTTLPG